MRREEENILHQIRDLRRAGYASDFAGSLSLFRQTFLKCVVSTNTHYRGPAAVLCGQTAMGNQPLLWRYLAVSRVRSRFGNINRGARMGCIPIFKSHVLQERRALGEI